MDRATSRAVGDTARPALIPMDRLSFCTITQEPGHGGIARVSSLIWRVVQGCYKGPSELLTAVSPGKELTICGKIGFSGSVYRRQLLNQCDLLVFDHLGLARTQSFVPDGIRKRYAVFLHSVEAWESLTGSRLNALRNATLRIANSRYTAERIAAANPGVGPIDVCHLALDPENSNPDAKTSGLPVDPQEGIVKQIRPNSVLIVGRMLSTERYKGHDQLIRAWPLVLRQVRDAQLVIVGRGDDIPRLKALAAEVGVSADVLFTGPVDECALWAIYDRVSVFAMPSRAEGFGLVYLEAMQHRLACVGSVHDAAREIIVDGETGFLVDQANAVDLAATLIRLLTDPALRRRLGCNGFERLQSSFSFERFEARMSELLTRLSAIAA